MKKEHPILFSTPMIQAILEGRKTQTRRVVKPQPDDSGLWNDDFAPRSLESTLTGWNGTVNATGEDKQFKCPYGKVGDNLWVRETFAEWGDGGYAYKADGFIQQYEAWERDTPKKFHDVERIEKFTPSIFMPRKASRILLEVTNIRVARLWDISEQDAKAEGVQLIYPEENLWKNYLKPTPLLDSAKQSFISLWHRIHNTDPVYKPTSWVWVFEFKIKK